MIDRGPFIALHTGRRWHFLDPRTEDIHIDDVAWSLAHSNRFNGHAGAYSTLTHSCHVADIVRFLGYPELEVEALSHDGHEMAVGDVSSPFKKLLPDYARYEAEAEYHMRQFFGLPATMHPVVKQADLMACMDEGRVFLPLDPYFHTGPFSGLPVTTESPVEAMERWCRRIHAAMRERDLSRRAPTMVPSVGVG